MENKSTTNTYKIKFFSAASFCTLIKSLKDFSKIIMHQIFSTISVTKNKFPWYFKVLVRIRPMCVWHRMFNLLNTRPGDEDPDSDPGF